MKIEAPPRLAQLADPYDPAVNAAYVEQVNDISYYKGKIYLYFGVTPALVLFWPYASLTGHYLSDKDAVVIFLRWASSCYRSITCGLRHYFPEASIWVAAVGMLALGLVIVTQKVLTLWCNVYEIAIVCGLRSQCWRWRRSGVHCMMRNGRFCGADGKSGLWIGNRVATIIVVWGNNPFDAGGSGVARGD